MSMLIIGCGFLGQRVAAFGSASGEMVYAVTRRPQRADHLRRCGLEPILADVTCPESLRALPPIDRVLFSVSWDRSASPSPQEVYVGGLMNVLDCLPDRVRTIVVASTTGVYGRTDGSWVDETSPCAPRRETARACLEAEQHLHNHPRLAALDASQSMTATVLRLGGLYGAGRYPRRTEILAGRPLPVRVDTYLNLIHVEDAVAAVMAAWERSGPWRCYNVVDGSPVRRGPFFTDLAASLSAPTPQFIAPRPTDSQRAWRSSHQRVCNRRMMAELQVPLRFPSYRQGLALHSLPD